jgi:transposase-like protein
MDDSVSKPITPESKFFLLPKTPTQRKYEALRAYFVDQHPSKEVAREFGYTNGAFRVLCHSFRKDPDKKFFLETRPGPRFAPKRDQARARVIALRKQNYSTEDISRLLREEGVLLSAVSVWAILNEEGFERLPRRYDEDRPKWPRPDQAPYADVRQFSLLPRVMDSRGFFASQTFGRDKDL